MPAKRAWFYYPYAVVKGATFQAQVKGDLAEQHTFLEEAGGDVARVRAHSGHKAQSGHNLFLRVSDDGNMAIENTDLTRRQPKVFYATTQVIDNSNDLLEKGKSLFRLAKGAQALTVLPDWTQTKHLYEVTMEYRLDALPPQNCDAMAAGVLGMSQEDLVRRSATMAQQSARAIGGISQEQWTKLLQGDLSTQKLERHMAEQYVLHRDERVAEARGANQFAQPEVGDAFAIITIGDSQAGGKPGTKIVRDIRAKEERELGWTYHFGGVVARSGRDRITLENYARGDDRQAGGDPRWYFQMFGAQKTQSFHEFYSGKKDYANPVTIVYKNPNQKDESKFESKEKEELVGEF